MASTPTKIMLFLFYLIAPVLTVPLVVNCIASYNEQAAFDFFKYANWFHPIAFCLYGLLLGRLSGKLIGIIPKVRHRQLLFSILYCQASYLILLLFADKFDFLRLFLLLVVLLFLGITIIRPTYNSMLFCGVFYFSLSADSIVDYYFRVNFLNLNVSIDTIGLYLVHAFIWIVTCIVITLSIKKNQLKLPSHDSSIRYLPAYLILLLVVIFAHLYYNIALFTKGNAFEYKKAAVTSDWKRKMAKEFPGVPKGIYEQIIDKYSVLKNPHPSYLKVKDTASTVTTYEPDEGEHIGLEWASLYETILTTKGASHYRIIKSSKPTNNIRDNLYELQVYQLSSSRVDSYNEGWRNYPEVKVYSDEVGLPFTSYEIYLPKHMPYNKELHLGSSPPPLSPGVMGLVCGPGGNLILRTRQKDKNEFEPEIYEKYMLGIDSLSMYLRYSRNFLDDSVVNVRNIMATEFLDSFTDYIYLSVATIFSAGYDDIKPIEPKVHLLSLAETVMGWFLLLYFGSHLIPAKERVIGQQKTKNAGAKQ